MEPEHKTCLINNHMKQGFVAYLARARRASTIRPSTKATHVETAKQNYFKVIVRKELIHITS